MMADAGKVLPADVREGGLVQGRHYSRTPYVYGVGEAAY